MPPSNPRLENYSDLCDPVTLRHLQLEEHCISSIVMLTLDTIVSRRLVQFH
jgi:hypothetical protein